MAVENGRMKLLLTALLSMLVTGTGAWFAFGSGTASTKDLAQARSEMISYINDSSSYAKDRGVIVLRLDESAQDMAGLKAIVASLASSQATLVTEQRVLLERLNRLLDIGQPK